MRSQAGFILPVILVALAVLVAGGGAYFFTMRRGDMPPDQAKRLVDSGALLVDVRTREEFAAGHVPGAVNLPVQELDQRMSELPRDRDLVLYCRSGHRSGRAAGMLKDAGYAKVHNLGAMSRWPGPTTASP